MGLEVIFVTISLRAFAQTVPRGCFVCRCDRIRPPALVIVGWQRLESTTFYLLGLIREERGGPFKSMSVDLKGGDIFQGAGVCNE